MVIFSAGVRLLRYWWVNHAQTQRQEVDGGYLWSPRTKANGHRNKFYDTMRLASPGDIVFSYAKGRIGKIGLVGDFAISAPKPAEFGSIGEYWNASGWLLPVNWLDLPIALPPKSILGQLGPMLRAIGDSPISPMNGNGYQHAYLAEISEEITALILDHAGYAFNLLSASASVVTASAYADQIDQLVEQHILSDLSLDETTRRQITNARRGQGVFRRRVLDVEPICRITGIDTPTLLIASHMQPWRSCSTAAARLDGYNGLMLAPHADFLFDGGLLSFENDGRTIISSRLSEVDAAKLGLGDVQRPPPRPFNQGSIAYLEHHRQIVFLP